MNWYKTAQEEMVVVPVHMLAFMEGKNNVRNVKVPKNEISDDIHKTLEAVFKYGQNDFQPQAMPSVSVGDVAEYMGNFYEVKMMGFEQITKEDFAKMDGNRARNGYKF